MKNELLILSFAVLSITEIEAAEGSNKGGVILPPSLHKSYDLSGETTRNGSREMANTNNPDELARRSDELFEQGKFKECAEAFLSSAIYGNIESREAIEEINPKSVEHLRSGSPQSAAALSYYKSVLIPALIKYFEEQSVRLNVHANKPVKVFGEQ